MRSAVLFAGLLALALATAFAGPHDGPAKEKPEIFRQKATRVKLPTDSAISVYVGCRGTWQSRNLKVRPVTGEYAVDIASYDLQQTPSADNFRDHVIFTGPLGKDGNWYAFSAVDDKVDLVFDVRDTKRRLDKIVIVALDDGRVRGSINAKGDGTAIRGPLHIGDDQGQCRVNGYARDNRLLFVIAIEP